MRDYQKFSVTSGKNFPGTGPLGPWIVTTDEIPDPTRLTLTTRLNGQQMQHSGTDMLIYSVPQIVAFCSDFTPLLPGDVIATGTPEGVGHRRKPPLWMKPGDVLEVEISGIGTLREPRSSTNDRREGGHGATEEGIACDFGSVEEMFDVGLAGPACRARVGDNGISGQPTATKVSFGQVSPTATIWPAIVATKKGFFANNGVELDMVSIGVSPGMQAVASGSLNIMHNTCNAPISFIEAGGSGVHISLVSMGHSSRRRGRQEGRQERRRPQGPGGRHIVDQVWLDHPAAAGIEGARPRAVRLRRYRRPGQCADLPRAAGGRMARSGWCRRSRCGGERRLPVIGTFREVAPKFPFVCFVTNDNWVKNNTAVAQGFAKAWLTAVAWLYDPANRAEAEKLLAEAFKLQPAIAAGTYDELIARVPDTFPRDGKVDPDVLSGMIDVMVEGGELSAAERRRPPLSRRHDVVGRQVVAAGRTIAIAAGRAGWIRARWRTRR